MPYHIITSGDKHCVTKEGEDSPIEGGCHATEQEAKDHMAALYASEGEAHANGKAAAQSEQESRNGAGTAEVNTLKAVGQTADELRLANYIILFDSKDLAAFGDIGVKTPRWKNSDGTIGDHFARSVDVESDYTAIGRLPIDWEHGREWESDKAVKAPGKNDILGYVDWGTAKRDEKGIFVERVLNRHNKYVQWIEELVQAGIVGTSSQAVPNGEVEIKATGEITKWPLYRDTLTVMPMEPRMKSENVVRAMKALGLEQAINSGSTAGQPEPDSSTASNVSGQATPTTEDLPMEELETLKSDVAEIKTGLKAIGDKLSTAGDGGPTHKPSQEHGGTVPAEPRDQWPYKALGQQLKDIKDNVNPQRESASFGRLKAVQEEWNKATGLNEQVGSEGEFLLQPTFTAAILQPMHEQGPFTQAVRRLPVGTNSNMGTIYGVVNETSRATGSRWGGIRGYRLAEGGTKTPSKPDFREISWKLKKYAVLMYATDELLQDATQLNAILRQGASEELNFMANDDVYRGPGTGGPTGALNSPALISVSKETGQAAATVVMQNLLKMWQRVLPRSRGAGSWYINSEVEPQLWQMFIAAGVSALEPRFISYSDDGTMRIFGRPVVVNEFSSALGTAGDILFGDFSEYLYWEKGGEQVDTSIHVAFTTDETAYRVVYRCDGKTHANSPITPFKGSSTQSAFVALADRS